MVPRIDLTKFCSKDDSRLNIKEPFSKGKWTYATDGRIAIRVPMLLHILEKNNAPDAERIFKEADERGPYEWVPVLEVKVETATCKACNGTGKLNDVSCDECDGAGCYQKSRPEKFQLGEVTIGLNVIYLDLIRKELPNPKIGLVEAGSDSYTARPVKIKFDGGEGLLMPMRLL